MAAPAPEAVMEATMPATEPVAPARALVKIGIAATGPEEDAEKPVGWLVSRQVGNQCADLPWQRE